MPGWRIFAVDRVEVNSFVRICVDETIPCARDEALIRASFGSECTSLYPELKSARNKSQ